MAKKLVKAVATKITTVKPIKLPFKPKVDSSVVAPEVVPNLDTDEKLNLSTFSIDQIVEWRNSASKRVAERDIMIDNWAKMVNDMSKAQKKNHTDLTWISRLNRHLNVRVFKYATKPSGE